jgi:3-oxoacyl-[acyl-carrier protein] reductase
MKLGLKGKSAIVCASSRGLGFACAQSLANEGVTVVINGRIESELAEAATQIERMGRCKVKTVAADVATESGRAALLSACPEPDILVTNNAGPLPRALDAIEREHVLHGLELNFLAPLALMCAVAPRMALRGFGRIVNITSISVLMPMPALEVSSAARAGLTTFAIGLARSLAPSNVTVNNILPGYFETERLINVFKATAEREGITLESVRQRQLSQIPCGRLGAPSELGDLCAFMCSPHAGYLTGQNILIDGGLFDRHF